MWHVLSFGVCKQAMRLPCPPVEGQRDESLIEARVAWRFSTMRLTEWLDQGKIPLSLLCNPITSKQQDLFMM